jgi:pimeloyl-CoA synthetase
MAIVENFMNKIMSNEEFNNDFKNMKIENISRDQEKGQKIITFTVEARLR